MPSFNLPATDLWTNQTLNLESYHGGSFSSLPGFPPPSPPPPLGWNLMPVSSFRAALCRGRPGGCICHHSFSCHHSPPAPHIPLHSLKDLTPSSSSPCSSSSTPFTIIPLTPYTFSSSPLLFASPSFLGYFWMMALLSLCGFDFFSWLKGGTSHFGNLLWKQAGPISPPSFPSSVLPPPPLFLFSLYAFRSCRKHDSIHLLPDTA